MELIVSPDYLHWLMRRNGLRAFELAELAGTNASTVSRLINGVQTSCYKNVGPRIEQALKEEPGSLFAARGTVVQKRKPRKPAKRPAEVAEGSPADAVVPELVNESQKVASREAAA